MKKLSFAGALIALGLAATACSHAPAQITTDTRDTTDGAKGVATAPTSTAPASAPR